MQGDALQRLRMKGWENGKEREICGEKEVGTIEKKKMQIEAGKLA